MDYREWPPDPPEPWGEDPATGAAHDAGPDSWSAWQSSSGHSPHRQPPPYGHEPAPPPYGHEPASPAYGHEPAPPPYGQGQATPPAYATPQPYGSRGAAAPYGHSNASWSHRYREDPYATQLHPAAPPERPGGPRLRPTSPPATDPEQADESAWMPVLAWTAGFFVVPVALYLVWAATRSGVAPAGCVDPSGAPCDSPRASALSALVNTLPGLAGALTLALAASAGLRRLAGSWRPSTVAFASCVIGAGAATLIARLLA